MGEYDDGPVQIRAGVPSVPRGDLMERAEKLVATEREPRDIAAVHVALNEVDRLTDILNRLIETTENRMSPVLRPTAEVRGSVDGEHMIRPNSSPLVDRINDVSRRLEYGLHRLASILESAEV